MAVFIWVGNWLTASIPLHGLAAKATALILPTAFGSGALILSLFVLRVLDPALLKSGWVRHGATDRKPAGFRSTPEHPLMAEK